MQLSSRLFSCTAAARTNHEASDEQCSAVSRSHAVSSCLVQDLGKVSWLLRDRQVEQVIMTSVVSPAIHIILWEGSTRTRWRYSGLGTRFTSSESSAGQPHPLPMSRLSCWMLYGLLHASPYSRALDELLPRLVLVNLSSRRSAQDLRCRTVDPA